MATADVYGCMYILIIAKINHIITISYFYYILFRILFIYNYIVYLQIRRFLWKMKLLVSL